VGPGLRARAAAQAAAAAPTPAKPRWEKSRDADEPYLDRQIWNRLWTEAVGGSGIPFKPTAYQVRHTHASWLIDAGDNPKSVMHRLGQADLRTTSRYVHVLDEAGESAARRFEGVSRWLQWVWASKCSAHADTDVVCAP
jgi:integrase